MDYSTGGLCNAAGGAGESAGCQPTRLGDNLPSLNLPYMRESCRWKRSLHALQ